MGIEKILLSTLRSALKSGKAVGAEVKVAKVTEFLSKHPKAAGEEIGNLLGGKGKKVTDAISALGGFDKAFAEINRIAQQYPGAVVKIGVKESKHGFRVAKISVKNGKKNLYSVAASVDKQGCVKYRGSSSMKNSNMNGFDDGNNFRIVSSDNITALKTEGTLFPLNVTANLGKKGEVVSAHIQRDLKNAEAAAYELEGGLLTAQLKHNGIKADVIADTGALKETIKAEVQASKEIIEPITTKLLRSLRERFNTAIDLFKFNGHKDFEKFVSPVEMKEMVAKLAKEETELVDKIKIAKLKVPKTIDTEALLRKVNYHSQIKSDIKNAKELLKIYC